MSVLADIASAVSAALKSSLNLTAPVSYAPLATLEASQELRAWVKPEAVRYGDLGPEKAQRNYDVHVVLAAPAKDASASAAMVTVGEQIADLFVHKRLPGYEKAVCLSASLEPATDEKRLMELHQHATVVVLRYRVIV